MTPPRAGRGAGAARGGTALPAGLGLAAASARSRCWCTGRLDPRAWPPAWRSPCSPGCVRSRRSPSCWPLAPIFGNRPTTAPFVAFVGLTACAVPGWLARLATRDRARLLDVLATPVGLALAAYRRRVAAQPEQPAALRAAPRSSAPPRLGEAIRQLPARAGRCRRHRPDLSGAHRDPDAARARGGADDRGGGAARRDAAGRAPESAGLDARAARDRRHPDRARRRHRGRRARPPGPGRPAPPARAPIRSPTSAAPSACSRRSATPVGSRSTSASPRRRFWRVAVAARRRPAGGREPAPAASRASRRVVLAGDVRRRRAQLPAWRLDHVGDRRHRRRRRDRPAAPPGAGRPAPRCRCAACWPSPPAPARRDSPPALVVVRLAGGPGAMDRFAARARTITQVSDRQAHVMAGLRLGALLPMLGGGSESFAMPLRAGVPAGRRRLLRPRLLAAARHVRQRAQRVRADLRRQGRAGLMALVLVVARGGRGRPGGVLRDAASRAGPAWWRRSCSARPSRSRSTARCRRCSTSRRCS